MQEQVAWCWQGIETLLEDMVRADAEWSKLVQVPGLVDGWTDVKDKVGIATEEFKASSPPPPPAC